MLAILAAVSLPAKADLAIEDGTFTFGIALSNFPEEQSPPSEIALQSGTFDASVTFDFFLDNAIDSGSFKLDFATIPEGFEANLNVSTPIELSEIVRIDFGITSISSFSSVLSTLEETQSEFVLGGVLDLDDVEIAGETVINTEFEPDEPEDDRIESQISVEGTARTRGFKLTLGLEHNNVTFINNPVLNERSLEVESTTRVGLGPIGIGTQIGFAQEGFFTPTQTDSFMIESAFEWAVGADISQSGENFELNGTIQKGEEIEIGVTSIEFTIATLSLIFDLEPFTGEFSIEALSNNFGELSPENFFSTTTSFSTTANFEPIQIKAQFESVVETFLNNPMNDNVQFSSSISITHQLSEVVSLEVGPFEFSRESFPNDPGAMPEASRSGALSINLDFASEIVQMSASFGLSTDMDPGDPSMNEFGFEQEGSVVMLLTDAASITLSTANSFSGSEFSNELGFVIEASF